MNNFKMNDNEFKKVVINNEEEFEAEYCHECELELYEKERNSVIVMEYYPNLMETEDFGNEYEYLCKYVTTLIMSSEGDGCACVTVDNYTLEEEYELISHKPILALHIYLSADHVAEMRTKIHMYITDNMDCARRYIPAFEHDSQIREKLQNLAGHSIRSYFFDKTDDDCKSHHIDCSLGILKNGNCRSMFAQTEAELKNEDSITDYDEVFREYYEWHDCCQDA